MSIKPSTHPLDSTDLAHVARALGFGSGIRPGLTPEEKEQQEAKLRPYMRGTRSPW